MTVRLSLLIAVNIVPALISQPALKSSHHALKLLRRQKVWQERYPILLQIRKNLIRFDCCCHHKRNRLRSTCRWAFGTLSWKLKIPYRAALGTSQSHISNPNCAWPALYRIPSGINIKEQGT